MHYLFFNYREFVNTMEGLCKVCLCMLLQRHQGRAAFVSKFLRDLQYPKIML